MFSINYTRNKRTIDPSVYYTGTQVQSAIVDPASESVLIAAGAGGVHKVSLFPRLSGAQILDLGHEVYDVCLGAGKLYVAEGLYGMSVWEYDSGKPGKHLGRYKSTKGGIYQLVVKEDSNVALLQANNTLEALDVSDTKNMIKIFEDRNPHLMYRNPIPKQIFDSQYFGSMWLGDCYLYEIQKEKEIQKIGKIFSSIGGWNISFGPINGFIINDKQAIAICDDGLLVKDSFSDDEYKLIAIEGMQVSGKSTLSGANLYCSDKRAGIISAIDISTVDSPKKRWQRNVGGNPGFVIPYKDMLIVPAGNGGLQVLNSNSGDPYY